MGKVSSKMGVYLMKGTGTSGSETYAKLVDIVSFPDMGGAPETLDGTTLSDEMEVQEEGITKLGALEFDAFLDESGADLESLEALKGTETQFALYVGKNASSEPDGHVIKYKWKGKLSVWVVGGGVNELIKVKISIARTTKVEKITD